MLELISLHIPKTAGKSFDAMLRRIYGDEHVLWIKPLDVDWVLRGLAADGPERMPRVVGGHFTFRQAGIIHRQVHAPVVAWLRDPVERVISNYFYFIMRIRDGYNPRNAHRWDEKLLEYASKPETRNLMSKFLDGVDLRDLFYFGLTEHFVDDLAELAGMLGWPKPEMVHVNSSGGLRAQFTPVPPENREQILKWNRHDVALYKEALGLRELRRARAGIGGGLAGDEPGRVARGNGFGAIDWSVRRRRCVWAVGKHIDHCGALAAGPGIAGKCRRAAGRLLAGRRRAVPDFVIVGAHRCGIGAFFLALAQHPDIRLTTNGSPSMNRSLHVRLNFFDRHYYRGLDWYRSLWPDAPGLTGEATPSYILHPDVPGRILAANPDARIIMVFRNPVQRAFSHYIQLRHRGRIADEMAFEDKIANDIREIEGIDMDRLHLSLGKNVIYRGLYACQYRVWERVFGSKRLLALRAEDFFLEPEAALNLAYRFLGLSEFAPRDVLPPPGNNGREAMKQDTRERLEAFFRPHNGDLERCTGIDWSCA